MENIKWTLDYYKLLFIRISLTIGFRYWKITIIL